MFFSKAILSREALGQDRNWELATNGYRAHQLVWSLFSDRDDRDRDFIFRWETHHRRPILYTVSSRHPQDAHSYFNELHSKPYDPSLHPGQPLAFALRANAVVKKRDDQGKQKVHDVVMNAKYEMRQRGQWEDRDLTHAQLVHREGLKWLQRRQDQYGFTLNTDQVVTESYERHAFKKPGTNRRVVIATIDYRGQLQVAHPPRLIKALFEGVGPSKAFGCGLMMVRPI